MAQIDDLPAPVVGARARLHRHRAARLRCQKFQYFPATQLLAERDRSIGPRAVQLKAVLGQIDSDHANLVLRGRSQMSFFRWSRLLYLS